MRKSITKRIKISSNGKIQRRATSLGHSRSNKSKKQYLRKKGMRSLDLTIEKTIQRYL